MPSGGRSVRLSISRLHTREGRVLRFDDIKPGSRLRGLDSAGIAEVVQVARFGSMTGWANVWSIAAKKPRSRSSKPAVPMPSTLMVVSCV
jgi:hypothetical protein